jgi:hypothetical protein
MTTSYFVMDAKIESVYKVRIVILGRLCPAYCWLDPGIQNLLKTMDSRLRTSGMTNRKKEFIHRH